MSTGLDIETVLTRAKDVALDISNSAVSAFESRCGLTRGECAGLHYSACRSRLPGGECTTNSMTVSDCLEEDCGSVQDFSQPVVQVPGSVQDADGKVTNLDAIETVCYGIGLNDPLETTFKDSQSPDDVSSIFTYFGSWTGVMRTFPGANYGGECGDYDPRVRPWYVAASSGPKDVVIVVDISGSMEESDRWALATDAVTNVLGTMNEHTFVNIVLFDDRAEVLTPDMNFLVRADTENKEMLLRLFADVMLGDGTNFEEAMTTTFSLLETSRAEGKSSGCSSTAILFLSDGENQFGVGFDDASEISSLVDSLNVDIGAQIFTFALGPTADSATLKTIACGNGGIFQAIPDGGSLPTAMAFYYRYYAIGLGDNTDYTVYSSIYEFVSGFGGLLGFSVISPTYDRSFDPPAFLGVSGVDYAVQSFIDLGFTEGEIRDAVFQGGTECPVFSLTYCQLQQFRGSISAESVCDFDGGCTSNSTISLEPERCMEDDEYPDNLWRNEDFEEYTYLERNCCGSDVFDPSISTPTCEFKQADDDSMVTVIASVAAVAALLLLCFGGWCFKKNKTGDKTTKKEPVFQLPTKSPGRARAQPKEAHAARPVQEVEK